MNDTSWFIPDHMQKVRFEHMNSYWYVDTPAMKVDDYLGIHPFINPVKIICGRGNKPSKIKITFIYDRFAVFALKSGKWVDCFSARYNWYDVINDIYKYHEEQIKSDDIDNWY